MLWVPLPFNAIVDTSRGVKRVTNMDRERCRAQRPPTAHVRSVAVMADVLTAKLDTMASLIACLPTRDLVQYREIFPALTNSSDVSTGMSGR